CREATRSDVHRFLAQATYSDEHRELLKGSSPEALAEELAKFGVRVDPADIPEPPRTIPTRDQCQKLILMFGLYDEYARAQFDYGSTTLAPLIMVVGYAMPLTATIESEV